MEVIILEDSNAVAEKAATYLCQAVKINPSIVLGLATGTTPVKMYEKIVQNHQKENIDFSKIKTFNLDEYVGLKKDHPASYFSYMKKNLFSKMNIPESNNYIPNGCSEDISQECESYENMIQEMGGIDLQILGIGRDGHIGFNEPSSSLSSRTRLKTLTEQTRGDNSSHFTVQEDVPFHVLTMGVGTIMEAKHIILLAFGKSKACAIASCVEGPITAMVPASILQMHKKVTILIDKEAASELKKQDYYRWVYKQKPSWQEV